MRYETVILGGGLSGAMAKAFFPGALLLERRSESSPLAAPFGATFYAHEFIPGFAMKPVTVRTFVHECLHGCGPYEYERKVYGDMVVKSSIRDFKPCIVAYKWEKPVLPASDLVRYNHVVKSVYPNDHVLCSVQGDTDFTIEYGRLITSIPLPIFLDLLRLDDFYIDFYIDDDSIIKEHRKSRPIYIVTVPRHPNHSTHLNDLEITYYPCKDLSFYRSAASVDNIVFELMSPTPSSIALYPGKITSNQYADELVGILRQKNIFCIGRYGLWRKGYLSHQTWHALEELCSSKNS